MLDACNPHIHQLLWCVERLLKTDPVCAIAATMAHCLNDELTGILDSVSNSIPTLEPGNPARPALRWRRASRTAFGRCGTCLRLPNRGTPTTRRNSTFCLPRTTSRPGFFTQTGIPVGCSLILSDGRRSDSTFIFYSIQEFSGIVIPLVYTCHLSKDFLQRSGLSASLYM